jgi:hypothetical protein
MNMDEKRLREVFSDEAFMESLFKLETPEEVQAAIKGKGVELTLKELEAFGGMLARMLDKGAEKGGELSAEDLDEVAGGVPVALLAVANIASQALKKAALPAAITVAATAAVSIPAFLKRW